MTYAAPRRPSRIRDSLSGAPSELELTLRIPLDRSGILGALVVEQSAYEHAKAALSTLEEDKLDLTEQMEHLKSSIHQQVEEMTFSSKTAREEAKKDEVAKSPLMQQHEAGLLGLNRAMIRAREDVSVFRHRMLTLRAALAPDPETAALLNEAGER